MADDILHQWLTSASNFYFSSFLVRNTVAYRRVAFDGAPLTTYNAYVTDDQQSHSVRGKYFGDEELLYSVSYVIGWLLQ